MTVKPVIDSTIMGEIPKDPIFRKRVEVNLLYCCQEIRQDMNKTDEQKRYASQVMNDISAFIDRFCINLAVRPDIHDNVDVDIDEEGNVTLSYKGNSSPNLKFDSFDTEIQDQVYLLFDLIIL